MRYDKTEINSMAVSVMFHIVLVLLLTFAIIKQSPQRVAFITDITLIDVKEYAGKKGEEKKSVGVVEKQKKLATVIKKKEIKKVKKKTEVVDVKAMLAKIEKEKAKLDMGISRENLRNTAQEDEEVIKEEVVEEVVEEELIAGGDPAITGDIAARKYKKFEWKFPEKLPEETELMVEIIVLSSGIVKSVKLARTSGYPELDRMALSQARKLQFDPLPFKRAEQVGVLLFKFGAEQ